MATQVINDITKSTINNPSCTLASFINSLGIWGEATFGPTNPKRILERAQEELQEAIGKAAINNAWTDDLLEEVADTFVILTRVPKLRDAVLAKMNINFDRDWDLRGDGTGYHISKDGDS